MTKAQNIYKNLADICIQKGLLSRKQSNTICRKGHRKQWAWKRHIIDLCKFVLWVMRDRDIKDIELEKLLEKSIEWCKT